eukprot:4664616-Amphidinium_carterae.1
MVWDHWGGFGSVIPHTGVFSIHSPLNGCHLQPTSRTQHDLDPAKSGATHCWCPGQGTSQKQQGRKGNA